MLAQGVAGTTDVVRCFAEIVPANGLFCARVRDASAYIGVNREVPRARSFGRLFHTVLSLTFRKPTHLAGCHAGHFHLHALVKATQ